MKTLGLRDIIGPIMVGPSSSHTAGALRIALMARSLCGSAPQKAVFRLLGSFAHTYQGHGTDKALVAGMLGFAADDLRVRDSFRWASAKGLAFSFTPDPQADDFAHPNTIDVTVTDESGCTVCVRGESIGGGAAVITRLDGIDVHITGEHTSVVVRQRDEAGVLAHIARCLSDEGVNIATTRMFRERRGQVAYTVLECDQRVSDKVRRAIAEHPGIFDVRVIPADSTASEGESAKGCPIDEGQALISFEALDFASGKELLNWCDAHDSTISQAFCAREEALCASQGCTADTQEYLKRALDVMRASTLRPIEEPAESMGGLLGSEAQRMRTFHASGTLRWAASSPRPPRAAQASSPACSWRSEKSAGSPMKTWLAGFPARPPWDSSSRETPPCRAPRAAARRRWAPHAPWRLRRRASLPGARPRSA